MPTFMQQQIDKQELINELFTLYRRKKARDGMLEVLEYRIKQVKEALQWEK